MVSDRWTDMSDGKSDKEVGVPPKKSEGKGNASYKMLKKVVYVLPTKVVNLFVSLNYYFSMSDADYQWLTDSI